MRFLRENNEGLSIEAREFLVKQPEFKSQIIAFESEFNIQNSLKTSKDLLNFVIEDVHISDYLEETDDGYIECTDWNEPKVISIGYFTYDNQLALEAYIEWEGNGIEYAHWVNDTYYEQGYYSKEYDKTVYASVDLSIMIPQNVEDWDNYLIENQDEIEYEVD